MLSLVHQCGLIGAIDRNVDLLQFRFPHHESDHVLNIADNTLTDEKCLEALELKRTDERPPDALGATGIPVPTTTGDFCLRFTTAEQVDCHTLTFWAVANSDRLTADC